MIGIRASVAAVVLLSTITLDPPSLAQVPARSGETSPKRPAAAEAAAQTPASAESPVYVAYYWRAKPGQTTAYNEYIQTIAEKIDEDARKAGAFEEVVTVTPSQRGTSTVITEWTHLRIFKLKNRAAVEGLSKALDAATQRVVPDEAQRKRNSERSAALRDFVRQELWTALR